LRQVLAQSMDDKGSRAQSLWQPTICTRRPTVPSTQNGLTQAILLPLTIHLILVTHRPPLDLSPAVTEPTTIALIKLPPIALSNLSPSMALRVNFKCRLWNGSMGLSNYCTVATESIATFGFFHKVHKVYGAVSFFSTGRSRARIFDPKRILKLRCQS
jgi:hypothetical protein